MHTITVTASDGRQATVKGEVNENYLESIKAFFKEAWKSEVEISCCCTKVITCPECGSVTSYTDDRPGHCNSCKVRFLKKEMVEPIEGRV